MVLCRNPPVRGDAGMSTVEYALVTLAAAALAAVLLTVVTGDLVSGWLTETIERALSGPEEP